MRRTTVTQAKTKATFRNLIRMKNQKIMSQLKGQVKTSEKKPNEFEIGKLPKKESRLMIMKMIQNIRETKKCVPET